MDMVATRFYSKKTRPFSLLEGGIPQGALTELSGLPGSGKTELVLKFLSENPGLKTAWVEENLTVYPCAFPPRGVSLKDVLFVETSDYLWAVQQLLKSHIFDVVVLSAPVSGEIQLRRIQIAAEKGQAIVIFLSDSSTKEGTWPLAVQIEVFRDPLAEELRLRLLKSRGHRGWITPVSSVG